jgi:hypothetical protein
MNAGSATNAGDRGQRYDIEKPVYDNPVSQDLCSFGGGTDSHESPVESETWIAPSP